MKLIARIVTLLLVCQYTHAQGYIEFVENKGQWGKEIKYKGEVASGSFALQATGYRVLMNHPDDMARIAQIQHPQPNTSGGQTIQTNAKNSIQKPVPKDGGDNSGGSNTGATLLRSHVYEMKFLNANPNPQIISEKPLATYSNYLIGNDPSQWASNCKTYQALTYKDVYPGIDVRYYTSEGVLKYDVIVHPGADPSQMAMYFEGTESLKVKDGMLQINTSVGEIREKAPYTYQLVNGVRTEIPCSFEVKGNIVRFKLGGNYSKRAALVIDPAIVFYGYTGSTADNWGFTATYDNQGNFYAGGIVFAGGQFPVSNGAFQRTFQGGVSEGILAGGWDMGIMKFDPTGANRIYSTYIGGTSNDQPHSMVVDNNGSLVISGRSNSGSSYPTRGLSTFGPLGSYDIVLTKLNPTGTDLISSLRIGGGSDDGINIRANYIAPQVAESTRRCYGDDARSEVILDGAGNVILASSTQSRDFRTTLTSFQPLPGNATTTRFQDGILIKLTPDLNAVLFSSFMGGNADDAAFVVAVNPANNNIYVAGATASNDLAGNKNGVKFPSNQGNIDGFVSIISPDGAQQIATSYFGTPAIDVIYGIQFDRFGFPYIMGTTTATWPVINSPFNNNGNQTNGKQFISKLRPDLSDYVYSTPFGTNTATAPNISPIAFLVDRCENVYVSGWGGNLGSGGGFPSGLTRGLTTTADAFKRDTDGEDFYFFVLEKNATSLLYASFFGQTGGIADHVDGGTSRFDSRGTIYQSICSCKSNGQAPLRGTAGVFAPDNLSPICNLLALKINLDFAGVGAGLQSSVNGVVRDTSGCVPLAVDFVDTLAQGKRYIWNFGDGSPAVTTTVPRVSHTFNNIGSYNVRLVSIDSTTCNISDTSFVTMRVRNDEAALAFTSTKLPPCESLSYSFNNTSVAPAGKPFTNQSFRWVFGDGSSQLAGAGPVTHTYASGGTYDVRLVLVDTTYCNAPDSITQQIRLSPNVVARFTTPAVGCVPYNAVFTNTSLGGQQFRWDFGDGTSSTQTNPTHLYAATGTYTIRLTAIDSATCNIIDSTRANITVSPNPTAAFTYTPQPTEPNTAVTFINNSSGGTLYKWLFGDGDSLVTARRDTTVQHLYNTSGTFNACLIAYNNSGCSDTTCQGVSIIIVPGIDIPNAFTPNGDGRNDRIMVRGFGIAKMTLRIYNRWGNVVYLSNNPQQGWDGTYKGVAQPQEVYHYTLQIEFSSGEKVSKKGDITLLR